jgi:hypothetical protein
LGHHASWVIAARITVRKARQIKKSGHYEFNRFLLLVCQTCTVELEAEARHSPFGDIASAVIAPNASG